MVRIARLIQRQLFQGSIVCMSRAMIKRRAPAGTAVKKRKQLELPFAHRWASVASGLVFRRQRFKHRSTFWTFEMVYAPLARAQQMQLPQFASTDTFVQVHRDLLYFIERYGQIVWASDRPSCNLLDAAAGQQLIVTQAAVRDAAKPGALARAPLHLHLVWL